MADKVLFLTVDFPPMGGGMSRYAYDTVLALKTLGADTTVIAPDVKPGEQYAASPDVRIIRPRGARHDRIFDRYLLSVLHFFLYGLRCCLTDRPRLILVNSWTVIGASAFLLRKIAGVPYIVFAHGLEIGNPAKSRKVDFLMRLVLGNAARVLANSSYTAKMVEERVPRARVTVVHPPLGPVVCHRPDAETAAPASGRRTLLTVGRLVEHKGQDMVLRSLPAVVRRFPDVVYRIVGTGPHEQALKDLACRLGLSGHVSFEGAVADEALPGFYREAAVFVMPSRAIPARGEVEGFGIVFLEAGAYGKPVIAGRSGGVPDAVADGVTGLLVDPTDPAQIASAVIRLLEDVPFAHRLGTAARERVARECSLEQLAAQLKDVMHGIR